MKLGRRAFLGGVSLAAIVASSQRALAQVLGYPRAIQGPMIGAPGPDYFTVWVRASGAFEVVLEYAADQDFRTVLTGGRVVAATDHDCFVVVKGEGQPAEPH